MGGALITLAALIAVVIVIAVLTLSVPPVGRYVLGQALLRGGPRFGAVIRFGRIEGNIMRSITISDFAVMLGADSIKVEKLSLVYDPWTSIAHRTFSASAAVASGPQLFIGTNRPSSGGGAKGRPRFPSIRVGQFHLSGGSVYVDSVCRLDSVSLALSLRSAPERVDAELSDVKAYLVQERVGLKGLRGTARLTPDSLVANDVVANTAGSSVRANLRMAFGPNAIAARIDSLSVSLPEFTSLPGRFRASGSAGSEENHRSGSVSYVAEGLVLRGIGLPAISGRLALRDSTVQLTMSGADTALGSADVSGSLDLRRLDFSGSAKLAGVRLMRLHSTLPEARADAVVEASGRGLDSVTASVKASVAGFDVERLTLTGTYVRNRERCEVTQLELSGSVGQLSGYGVWERGRLEADLRMEGFDLGSLSRLDSWPIQGKASGSVSVAGNRDTLSAVADLSVADLDVAGVRATRARTSLSVGVGRGLSGRVQVAIDSGSYKGTVLDSVRLAWAGERFDIAIWRPGIRVSSDGSARLTRDSVGVDVSALRITSDEDTLAFSDALQLSLRRDSLDIRLAAAGLAGGDVRAAFARAAGKPPRIEAIASRVDLARLRTLLGYDVNISGTASFSVMGSDSFDVVLDAERLRIPDADVELSRVQGEARLSRTRASFDRLWLIHQDSAAVPETSVVTGWFDYETQGGIKLGAADLRVRLRNPGDWVVSYLKSIIELRQGNIYGDLTVTGSLTEPILRGRVRVSRARLGIPVVGAAFDRVNAELVFDHSRITIEKLSGRSEHGDALVSGFVAVGKRWRVDSLRFHGDFSGTTVNPIPEVYGTIGGSLDLSWTLGRPFSLAGTVNVEEALVTLGFGQSVGSGTGAPDTSLVYDVRVRADRNIWLRNQLTDIELACDLAVRKTTRDVLYSGELTSRRGSVYYLDHTLRVDTGSVRFDNINSLNPDFYIAAAMPIRSALRDERTSMPDSIAATLTGTLAKPSLAFRSVPPGWDETEILSYLTLNATQEQLGDTANGRNSVNTLLSQRLLDYFQTQVAKRARGFVNLDYLEFESSLFDNSKQARVTVGKYVGRNLYVSYTQNFIGEMIPSFRVEYYINRSNEVIAEGTATGTPSDRYRTSLRYQFRLRY
ncbi:translocation/assembly module TamB domain-containing protein [candidate division WOR-3 bacterium]|nr:translocation/assembly module TamB domain-containing protein [candidate division WOR-3 bacterium]